MTPFFSIFVVSYTPCINIKRVKTADGTLFIVARIGSINIKPLGILHYVLNVPKLFVNLVSIQRIAKFDQDRLIFDDLDVFSIQ